MLNNIDVFNTQIKIISSYYSINIKYLQIYLFNWIRDTFENTQYKIKYLQCIQYSLHQCYIITIY